MNRTKPRDDLQFGTKGVPKGTLGSWVGDPLFMQGAFMAANTIGGRVIWSPQRAGRRPASGALSTSASRARRRLQDKPTMA